MFGQELHCYCRDPCPGDHDPNPEANDTPGLARSHGDSNKGCEENHTRCERVHCPSSLSLGGKSAGKHETCCDQRKESDPSCDDVQKAMPADGVGICRGPRWKTKGWISSEEASAD